MAQGKAVVGIVESKSLKRAQTPLKYFVKAIENLHDRNNPRKDKPVFFMFISSSIVRLHNIRFSMLNISDFKRLSNKSDIRYCIIISGLYLHGECARTHLYKSFGFNAKISEKIIQQYIDHGYIESFTVIIPKNVYGTYYKGEAQHIRLTAKGYDLADHISKLLIDPRFLP